VFSSLDAHLRVGRYTHYGYAVSKLYREIE